MKSRYSIASVLSVATLAVAALVLQPVQAADEAAGVGYGGPYVQLKPLMVPTHTSNGAVQYEVLTLRLVLDAGPRERPACFSAPIVHEKLLVYLSNAKLTSADMIGQRKDVLAKKLLEVAIASTDKGFYSAVEIVDADKLAAESRMTAGTKPAAAATPEEQLINKSKTLTTQCR